MNNILLPLFLHFGMISIISINGALPLAPEMHRFLVDEQRWMSHTQFNDSIALAQAAPGPNILFVGLLGWQAAGVMGGVVAMIGVLLPCSLLVFVTWRWIRSNTESRLVQSIRKGLSPLAVGLTLASGYHFTLNAVVPEATGRLDWTLAAVVLGTVLFSVLTKYNLLWAIGAGALVGVAASF